MSEYTEYARWMNKIKAGERNGNNTIVMELNSYNISGFFRYIVKQSWNQFNHVKMAGFTMTWLALPVCNQK